MVNGGEREEGKAKEEVSLPAGNQFTGASVWATAVCEQQQHQFIGWRSYVHYIIGTTTTEP